VLTLFEEQSPLWSNRSSKIEWCTLLVCIASGKYFKVTPVDNPNSIIRLDENADTFYLLDLVSGFVL
jgi:hypothetical protein